MTLSSTITTVERLGNGVATEFSFAPILIFDPSHLEVVVRSSTGALTTVPRGTGSSSYAVVATFKEGESATGAIRYPESGGTPLPTGSVISIRRVVPFIQEVNFENQGGYLPEVQEGLHDRHVMRLQQLEEEVDRAVKVPFGSDVDVSEYFTVIQANADAAEAAAAAAEAAAESTITIPSNSLILATGTSAANTLANRFSNLVSVDDFIASYSSGADHSTEVQAAITYAASVNKGIQFTSGRRYNLSAVRLINKSSPWVVEGNGCIIHNPATGTTDVPSLYHTALAAPGGSTRPHAFAIGVRVYNIEFTGTSGFGVGYKHVVSGNLLMVGCRFTNLESCVVLAATSHVNFLRCNFTPAAGGKGLFCARVAEDSYAAGYTAEGPGWNDGIHLDNVITSGGDYGVYYSGSTSEGVLTIRNGTTAGSRLAGVYLKSFQSFIYEGNWTEFFASSIANIIEFALDSGFEAIGTARIKGNHFYNGAAGELNYVIFNRSRMCVVEDNVFQIASTVFTGCVWHQSGTPGNFLSNLTLTPTRTASFNSNGRISFAKTDLVHDTPAMYYLENGTTRAILKPTNPNSPSGSVEFTMYAYTPVYPIQWAHPGANWLNVSAVSNVTMPLGYMIDFDTPLTGKTYSGVTSVLRPGVDANGFHAEPLIRMAHNSFIGVDVDKIFQQREFGYNQFYENREQ